MANEKTGAVKFVGDANTNCIEAQPYRDDNSANMNPGDVLEGIPESTLKRFLMNADFEPNDGVAEDVRETLAEEDAVRMNGAILRAAVGAEEGGAVKLEDMKKADLQAHADSVGASYSRTDNKEAIIAAIREVEGDATESADPLTSTTRSTTPPPPEGLGGQEGANA